MQQFLDGMAEDGVVMCHPGFVDDVLVGLDPLTGTREVEHALPRRRGVSPSPDAEQCYIELIFLNKTGVLSHTKI